VNLLWIKALHIIFVVTWFAGLFYIVRLFIYHREAEDLDDPSRSVLLRQYRIMERRLWYGITWPSMVLSCLFGLWFAAALYGLRWPDWLWLKLAFVLGLVAYQLYCQHLFTVFGRPQAHPSSFALRIWNEVTTLFLFAIVFIAVVKDAAILPGLLTGLVVLAVVMWIVVRLYRRRREK
jgi:putative membrane protein